MVVGEAQNCPCAQPTIATTTQQAKRNMRIATGEKDTAGDLMDVERDRARE